MGSMRIRFIEGGVWGKLSGFEDDDGFLVWLLRGSFFFVKKFNFVYLWKLVDLLSKIY